MGNVKLHINLSQGIIDAEGEEEFVWKVYEDFRERLTQNFEASPEGDEAPEDVRSDAGEPKSTIKSESKRRRKPRAAPATKGEKQAPGITSYSPKIDSELDTSGIKEFIAPYVLGSHTNTIVAFAKFLETKKKSPATFDQFFTCYRDAQLKYPEAFGQAFITARGPQVGLINFKTPDDVTLTLRGHNHFDSNIKKKTVE